MSIRLEKKLEDANYICDCVENDVIKIDDLHTAEFKFKFVSDHEVKIVKNV